MKNPTATVLLALSFGACVPESIQVQSTQAGNAQQNLNREGQQNQEYFKGQQPNTDCAVIVVDRLFEESLREIEEQKIRAVDLQYQNEREILKEIMMEGVLRQAQGFSQKGLNGQQEQNRAAFQMAPIQNKGPQQHGAINGPKEQKKEDLPKAPVQNKGPREDEREAMTQLEEILGELLHEVQDLRLGREKGLLEFCSRR